MLFKKISFFFVFSFFLFVNGVFASDTKNYFEKMVVEQEEINNIIHFTGILPIEEKYKILLKEKLKTEKEYVTKMLYKDSTKYGKDILDKSPELFIEGFKLIKTKVKVNCQNFTLTQVNIDLFDNNNQIITSKNFEESFGKPITEEDAFLVEMSCKKK